MYRNCLFCTRDLGRNDSIEAFPVGRRLAYDAAKGRLWVVCPACARWNLTPLDARYEAIDEAERAFRAARVRASTANVGLARLADGTHLVRVGRPTLPELTTWRYTDVFARRHRQATLLTAAAGAASLAVTGAVIYGALTVASASAGMLLLSAGVNRVIEHLTGERPQAPRAGEDAIAVHVILTERPVPVSEGALRRAVLRRADGGLALTFDFGHAPYTLVGERAESAAAAMLARINRAGAEPEFVQRALDRLVAAGSAGAFLASLDRRTGVRGPASAPSAGFRFAGASAETRLALEMALTAARERRAMEGELAELERAWRDAEALAAIADDLGLPSRVERALARLRARAGRERPADPA